MAPSDDQKPSTRRKRGPRGGTTTISVDGKLQRKAFFLPVPYALQLRQEAFDRNVDQTAIIVELLAERYGPLPDDDDPEAEA